MKKTMAALVLPLVVLFSLSLLFTQPFDGLHPQRVFAQHLRNMTSGETRNFVAHCDPGPFYETYVTSLESIYETKAFFHRGIESPSS